MEKFKVFIELCEKREALLKSAKMVGSLFASYRDKEHQQLTKEIFEVANELNIIGLSKEDKYEVHIYNLNELQAICKETKLEVLSNSDESKPDIWYRHTAKVDNIILYTLERVSKEEHKKAQAI